MDGPPHDPLTPGLKVQRLALNASWLLKLRWIAVLGQLSTILVVRFLFGVELPFTWFFLLIGMEALTNLAAGRFFTPSRVWGVSGDEVRRVETLLGAVMVFDIFVLTGLLYLSGGAVNPFCFFFLVHIVLAGAVLPAFWGWILALQSLLCFLFLSRWHLPLPELGIPPPDPAGVSAWRMHTPGLLVAFAVSAMILFYFLSRMRGELFRLEGEVLVARRRKAKSDHLEAMATLAAGAAHELASPLSTIAVVAKELDRCLAGKESLADLSEDVQLIRTEVDRCRRILDQMAADSGESAGEPFLPCRVSEIVDDVLEGLPGRVRFRVDRDAGAARLVLPKRAVVQGLRGLLKNALDASKPGQEVVLEVQLGKGTLDLRIEDRGRGMEPEILEKAGNPFFTTKEPGKGMGLGLFLARTVLERLGGTLDLDSKKGHGTVARVTLPLS